MENEKDFFENEEENEVFEQTPSHEVVRKSIFEMQKASGAAIKPFGLLPLFYKLLQTFQPNKMNKVKARNVSDVFSALQNEHFVINFNGKNTDWFYMTLKRWQKYGLGRKAIYNSVMFLKFIGVINTEIRPRPLKEQNKVRYYKFNLDRLKDIEERINMEGKRKAT